METHLLLVGPEQEEDELRDYERLCATAEAFDYVAMTRLMVRRLARAWDSSNIFSRHSGE